MAHASLVSLGMGAHMPSMMRTGLVLLLTIFPVSIRAQVISEASLAPTATADSERWYVAGDPISYSGTLYYPSGAQIHFNANEMIRVGSYLGTPVYLRTTIEPYSMVFIPVRGGMMQPYERRREGDLAGTAGSTAPTLPTASTPDDTIDRGSQAAAPPTLVGRVPTEPDRAIPVGTAGGSADLPPVAVASPGEVSRVPLHTRIGPAPKGINAIYMDFDGRRWYSAGSAVRFEPDRMARIGEYRGFAIFADRASRSTRMYIEVAAGGSLVAPYSISRVQQ